MSEIPKYMLSGEIVCQKGIFKLEEWEDVNYCEHSFWKDDEPLTDEEVIVLLADLTAENKQLKQQLDYIQNSISNAIKHQKTELQQKALKEVIKDYNEWMLGHKR